MFACRRLRLGDSHLLHDVSRDDELVQEPLLLVEGVPVHSLRQHCEVAGADVDGLELREAKLCQHPAAVLHVLRVGGSEGAGAAGRERLAEFFARFRRGHGALAGHPPHECWSVHVVAEDLGDSADHVVEDGLCHTAFPFIEYREDDGPARGRDVRLELAGHRQLLHAQHVVLSDSIRGHGAEEQGRRVGVFVPVSRHVGVGGSRAAPGVRGEVHVLLARHHPALELAAEVLETRPHSHHGCVPGKGVHPHALQLGDLADDDHHEKSGARPRCL
mmetsp:Transcript_31215/g.52705  ORF Transcript_31215/g.52705 Transcript_31215/m.52705 type:complete len:274 (+) Transcript_31215:137-958(+)